MMRAFGKETGAVLCCVKNKAINLAPLGVLVNHVRSRHAVRIIQSLRYLIVMKGNIVDIPYKAFQATSGTISVD